MISGDAKQQTDTPDHQGNHFWCAGISHLSTVVNGACPAAFPVPIPNLSFAIAWPQGMDTSHITLASGTSFSMYSDFFNAWDVDAQAQRVRDCVDQGVTCNVAGAF